jgi:hypothetical protein
MRAIVFLRILACCVTELCLNLTWQGTTSSPRNRLTGAEGSFVEGRRT